MPPPVGTATTFRWIILIVTVTRSPSVPLFAVLGAFALAVCPTSGFAQAPTAADLARQVEVRRTTHGVPHIRAQNLVAANYALAYVQLKNQQLRVDILSARARGRLAGALNLLECIASIFVYGAIALYSGHEWLKAFQGGFLRRGMLEISTTYLLTPITIGAALVVLVLVWQLIKSVRQIITGADEVRVATPHSEISI